MVINNEIIYLLKEEGLTEKDIEIINEMVIKSRNHLSDNMLEQELTDRIAAMVIKNEN